MKRGSLPKQRYQCKKCKRYFYGDESKELSNVFLFDIETLPLHVYSWGIHKQFLNYDNVIKDWCILSFVAKPLFSSKVTSKVLTPKEAVNRDDKRIVNDLWSLFNNADILIAHNGSRFDVPKMNARFLFHGLPPPAPYKVIDTCTAAQRAFNFTSNKLDYLAKHLGLNPKIHTDFDLWKSCDVGDPDALKQMETYNVQDVFTLEDVYVQLRPWIPKHPNMSLYVTTDGEVCPHCLSEDLDWEDKSFYYTQANRFEYFRCNHCGAIGRASKNNREREKKISLTRVIT
jgi:RNase P subunit RPR2